MTREVTLSGKSFKKLVAAVTKFPNVGSFSGSETVNLSCDGGVLRATAVGVVLTAARVKAEGVMDLIAVSQRTLKNYADVAPDDKPVVIARSGNIVSLGKGRNRMEDPLMAGVRLVQPSLQDLPAIGISAGVAQKIKYLAAIAYNDTSRLELCCVMLSKRGLAYAVDQKAVVVLRLRTGVEGSVPLPLPIGRNIEAGNRLYVGSEVTALRAGCAVYSMPSLIKARKDFPWGTVRDLEASAGKTVATVSGPKLAAALDACVRCLQGLTQTASECEIVLANGKAAITGSNGGTRYYTTVRIGDLAKPCTFKVPLDSLDRARPFMSGELSIATNKFGDLFLRMEDGWSLFPVEQQKVKSAGK